MATHPRLTCSSVVRAIVALRGALALFVLLTLGLGSAAHAQGTASQTINFPPPASPVIYGVPPITLSATASSGLPVDFSVSSTGSHVWGTGTNLPDATFDPMAAAPGDGMIYVVGGYSQTQSPRQLNVNRQYNPATNTWALKAPMFTPRYGGAAVSINGIIYVAGGWGPAIPYNVLESYNPATDSWTSLATLSHLSGCGIAGAISGKMYLFTPCNGYNGYYALFDVYDPVANTWTSLSGPPTSHAYGAGGVINGKFYVVAGVNSSGVASSELDVYDPVANSWSTLAPMPTALINIQGGVINGKLYVTGGETDTPVDVYSTTTYVYDPVANSWNTDTPLPATLLGASAVATNGLLYVAGGRNPSTAVNTLQILSPGVCTIAGDTVTITSVGTCTVAADQAGNNNYAAAPEVTNNIVVSAAQISCSLTPALTITYYTIGETDLDVGTHSSDVSTNFVLPALGANGLPVFNPNATANSGSIFTPSDLLSDGEITWWSPTLNNGGSGGVSDVVETDAGPVSIPFSNNNFYPPNGVGQNDLNGVQAAVLSGTLYAPAAETLSFSIASDDVAFAYLDGQIACDDGGVHGATAVPCTTATVSPGNHTLKLFYADLHPVDAALDFSVITPNVCVSPVLTTPTITWPLPSAITYGTPLSATQLDATATGVGGTSLAGTYSYTPATGAVLQAGAQTLSVTFTPNDTTDYTTATATVPLTVNQATPSVTWATPSAITYGTPLSGTQLDAGVTGVGGTPLGGSFSYTPATGAVLQAGAQTLSVTFTPNDTTDYTAATVTVPLTVNKALSVTTVICPASVTYNGTAQTPCTASVASVGGFSQSLTPTYMSNLHAGTATATATFSGDTNHAASTGSNTFTVNKATPVITWANPATITYGTPLGNTQLNATANVPGTFFYTAPGVGINPAGTLLPAGTSALGAGFTPTDGADYNSVSAYVQITVNKATTTTTIAVTTSQTVTGTTATITATVHPQIGGTPTGTVTYYNGTTSLGSAPVGTPFITPVLPVGTDQLSAVYSGDGNFLTSTSAKTSVTSIAPTNIILTPALGHVFYPASSVAYTVIVPLKLLEIVSGTITVYDGTTVIGTFNVLPTGVLVGVTPQLSVGTHNLRAVYSGNSQYPPGESPIETVTVSAL